MPPLPTAQDVLSFWFEEIDPKQHFIKDNAFDVLLKSRFSALHEALCEDATMFTQSAKGKLAAIIVFDQFSRNMFRDQAKAFAADPTALALAKELIAAGDDLEFSVEERIFIYMPFMHAETVSDQRESVRLFKELGEETNIDYAIRHLEVIEQFNRFPHRNDALGRVSSDAEIRYIETPGTKF